MPARIELLWGEKGSINNIYKFQSASPCFLRDVVWCGGKGGLESNRLGFWSPYLSHGDKNNNIAKGFLWESNELYEALCTILFVSRFVYKLLCYSLESNTIYYWVRGPGFFGAWRNEGRWFEGSHVGHDEVEALSFPLTAVSTVPNCSMPTANVFSGYVFWS